MAKKNLLNFHAQPPEVLALFTSERLYRVAWKLNETFGIHLELVVENEKNRFLPPSGTHERHAFADPNDALGGFLIANKGSHGLLYQTKPLADYFLTWKCAEMHDPIRASLDLLRNDPFFRASYLFPQEMLKTQVFLSLFNR
ncbi:MAG: hypothetical protein RLZZ370_1097 [Bacteroidota bacterium]|jgi:hypothetical protein